MTKDKGIGTSEVIEDNLIMVEQDKLKEDQKVELGKAGEAYKCECLKSFNASRTGEVIHKFEFPVLQPLNETQRENRLLDMVHQILLSLWAYGPLLPFWGPNTRYLSPKICGPKSS